MHLCRRFISPKYDFSQFMNIKFLAESCVELRDEKGEDALTIIYENIKHHEYFRTDIPLKFLRCVSNIDTKKAFHIYETCKFINKPNFLKIYHNYSTKNFYDTPQI